SPARCAEVNIGGSHRYFFGTLFRPVEYARHGPGPAPTSVVRSLAAISSRGVTRAMADHERDGLALSADRQYRTLLAVSEAIVAYRDLPALFHELAARLHQVVRFDYLALLLHEAASNSMRLHVLETSEPTPQSPVKALPVEDDPAGWVWQTQHPLI